MIYAEPKSTGFLAAVQRLKRQLRRKEEKTRQAKQKARDLLRKMRP